MLQQFLALVVDEGKWLTASMGLALLAIAILLYRSRRSEIPAPRLVLAAMNLFFGLTIGTMAFGHLAAVTAKLALGTLEGSVPVFYAIGIALAMPSWWLIVHTRNILASDDGHGRATLGLTGWLTITLLALGIHNLPLAVPGVLNIGYQMHTSRIVGWTIVGLAVAVNVGLFIGSVIFLASGQSFEQFRGIQ